MVGGIVIEASESRLRPEVVFVDCHDTKYKQTCAILVEKNETSLKIEPGDSVWWQCGKAYWTPQAVRSKPIESLKCHVDYDIEIRKIGYSGLTHPDRRPVESHGEALNGERT